MLRRLIKRNIHVSWLIAAGCTGIVAGVISAQYVPVGLFVSIGWLLSGMTLTLTALWRTKLWMIVLVVIGGILIGLWRGSAVQADISLYQVYMGTFVRITGIVSEDGDLDKRGRLTLRLTDVSIDGRNVAGKVWLTTRKTDTIQRSDKVIANGQVSKGFGSFSASVYNADIMKVERPVPGDVALNVRNGFADGVRTVVDEPQASLGLGYLVGQRRDLPDELDVALQAAGLTHIVVASGYNLTILVRLARRLFGKISKYLSFIAASGMILTFIAITGLSPSMSRAGLVAGLSLLAWYYGRRFHPLVLLPFAMAITLIIQPSFGWGDLGWQLSFAAFAGVMILAPLLQAYFFGDKPEKPWRRILIETISAQVATLPILLLAFGKVSLVAPLANMLILPLVPLAMLLTFIAGLGGVLVGSAAVIIGFPAQILLTYMTQTAMITGNLPWAMQEFEIASWGAFAMYAALIIFTIHIWRKTRFDLRSASLVE